MKRTSSQVEAEELTEFKAQFGDFAKPAFQIWKLPEFDQGTVRDQLNRFYGWDESQSYAATWEFLRFFVLKAIHQDFDDEKLAPSPTVERVWQCLLMRPKFYYQLCHTLVADLVDYNADKTREPSRYAETLKLYEEQYKRKPDDKCWVSLEDFGVEEELEDEEEIQPKETEEDVEKAMYDMIQKNVRLTPFEVKQRWGHVISEEKLRKLWVNLIARNSLDDAEVEAPPDKSAQEQAAKKEVRKSRRELMMKNFIDQKYNDFGEGERYYIRCKNIGGSQLTVRAPKNSLVGRVKKLIGKILPNRSPQEMTLTQLDEKEPLDDSRTLLDYGIFKNSTFILSFTR